MRYLSIYTLVIMLGINQMQQVRAQGISKFDNLRDVPAIRYDNPAKPRPWDTDVTVLRDSIAAHSGRAMIGFKAPGGGRSNENIVDGQRIREAIIAEQFRAALEMIEGKGIEILSVHRSIGGASVRMNPVAVFELVDHPMVDYIEIPITSTLGSAGNTGSHILSSQQEVPWGVEMVQAPQAWAITRGAGARVFIIDTGIDNHEDLPSIPSGNCMGMSNGCTDTHGHGTRVAGVVMALDNNIGVVGVAPGLFFNHIYSWAGMDYQDVIDGIGEAILLNVDVINMSFFHGSYHAGVANSVSMAWNAGIVMVAAGGNTSQGSSGYSAEVYPASYSQVIGVSGVNEQGLLAEDSPCGNRSRYGPHVDLAAPFWAVSTSPTDQYMLECGTSYAAPHVTGTVALIKSLNPNLSPAQIFEILTSTADKTPLNGQERTDEYGYGILNTCQALLKVIKDYYDPPVISGPTVVCNTNSTFTLHNLPPGFTVTWSHDPALITYVSGQFTENYTVQAASPFISGSGTVSAVITGPCGPSDLISKTVWVGKPATPFAISGFPYNGYVFGSDTEYEFRALTSPGIGLNYYNWVIGCGSIVFGHGTDDIIVRTCTAPDYVTMNFDVSIRVGNDCGLSDWLWRTGYVVGGSGGIYMVYPNPASSEITVALNVEYAEANPEKAHELSINQVRIMDQMGKSLMIKNFYGQELSVRINISALPKGYYIVKINDGESHTILKD